MSEVSYTRESNVYGMPFHPTDEWSYWQNSKEDLEKARELYDLALLGDAKSLGELIEWTRCNALNDQCYDG
jgi:hypothetical protein